MILKKGFLSFFLILIFACSFKAYSQEKLILQKSKDNYLLDKYLFILEDKTGTLTINEAASDSMKDKYVYFGNKSVNQGFSNSSFWLRIVIVDTLAIPDQGFSDSLNIQNLILCKNEQLLEDIRVYYKEINANNKFTEVKAGSVVPVKDKVIETDKFLARFPVQKNIPDTVYLRVQSKIQLILSFNLMTISEYVLHSMNQNLFFGILLGLFLLLITYNTLFYFSIKEKVYLFYVLYISSFTIFIFTYQGYYLEIFGRNFYHDYFILPLFFINCAFVFWLMLTREFLQTKLYMPWAYKLFKYLIIPAQIIFAAIFLFKIPKLLMALSIYFLVCYLAGLVVAFIALKKGIYLSKYYLISTLGIAIFIFISSTSRNNILPIPYGFWTQNALSLGILWEALILAGAVGYRFNHLKTSKEIEKAMIRSQIAADLHDEVGSNLSAIALQSKMMLSSSQLNESSKKQLTGITEITSATTDIIRDIVWFINPYHDKSEDLLLRMKELASKMLLDLDYKFLLEDSNEKIFTSLPDLNKRRHIYLIFKEQLNNIVKHSGADKVRITLSSANNKFLMVVEDNGKGFKEDEIIYGEGLRNLKNRAVLAGGTIKIESEVSVGTKSILEIPLSG